MGVEPTTSASKSSQNKLDEQLFATPLELEELDEELDEDELLELEDELLLDEDELLLELDEEEELLAGFISPEELELLLEELLLSPPLQAARKIVVEANIKAFKFILQL